MGRWTNEKGVKFMLIRRKLNLEHHTPHSQEKRTSLKSSGMEESH